MRIFTNSAATVGVRLLPNDTGWDAVSAREAKEELANEAVLASPAEPAADGVAEMRRMVGTGCEGVSEEGRGDGARDELGAGGRDKSVLRIFYCSYLVVDVFRVCKCGKRGMSSVQQSRA